MPTLTQNLSICFSVYPVLILKAQRRLFNTCHHLSLLPSSPARFSIPQAPSLPFSIRPLDALGLSLLFPSPDSPTHLHTCSHFLKTMYCYSLPVHQMPSDFFTRLPHSPAHLFSLPSSVTHDIYQSRSFVPLSVRPSCYVPVLPCVFAFELLPPELGS